MAGEVSIGTNIRTQWDRLSGLPGGKKLFSVAIGKMAPYTGTVGAVVDELEPGYSKVLLKDRKKVRNHLNSVHAVALVNLGEVTTGLAVMSGMPDNARGILKGLSIEYHKKARGLLTAECRTEIPETNERKEFLVEGQISDESGDVVATVQANWLIGPMRSAQTEDSSATAASSA